MGSSFSVVSSFPLFRAFPVSFPPFTLAVLAFLSFAETNGIEGEN